MWDILLMGVRWYVAYPLSYRHVEELLEERGVPVDHATMQRWVVQDSPLLEAAFHRRKRSVWLSWRMDETSIKVKGQWYDLYRALDNPTATLLEHVLLTQGFMGVSKAAFPRRLRPQNRDSTWANLANALK